uniref:Major facilitator superfamily (MFS) profile domain-containing protein n=1 Tax=Graphocephala atropunctata TaxID=36148 RepID=A0A1B6MDF6_9HEMI
METDKIDDGSKRQMPMYEVPVPQQVGIFGSAVDFTASYVDVRFSVSGNASISTLRPQIIACICTAAFHLTAGITLGFSAILIPQLEAPDSEIKVNKEDISWIASVIALVVPVGAVFTGYIVDRIGRTNTIRLAAVPYIIGWICIATAHNFTFLIIGRLLTGISSVMGTSPAIVYITEVARADLRGTLLCLGPSLASLGLVMVYTMGAFLHWRMTSWISIACCILPLLLMYLLSPESPVWLVSRGKTEEALKSLTYFHRRDKKAGLAEQKLEELKKEHNRKQSQGNQKGSSFRRNLRAFLRPTGYKPILLLTTIFIFQQFSGIYITIFYAVTLLKSVGTSMDPNLSAIVFGIVRLITGLLTLILLNKFGRRPLFIVSSTGMAIFIFISGYYTKEITEGHMEKNIIPELCVLLYVSVASFGFMSIPWTMTAELFPIEIRGMAQSLMMAVANLIMFSILKVYPFLDEMLGGAYAVEWLFASVSAASTVFIFLFLPETYNKELSEIQEYFKNNTVYIMRSKKSNDSEEFGEEMVHLKDTVQQLAKD